jgi:hypothetical protein
MMVDMPLDLIFDMVSHPSEETFFLARVVTVVAAVVFLRQLRPGNNGDINLDNLESVVMTFVRTIMASPFVLINITMPAVVRALMALHLRWTWTAVVRLRGTAVLGRRRIVPIRRFAIKHWMSTRNGTIMSSVTIRIDWLMIALASTVMSRRGCIESRMIARVRTLV